MPSPPSLTAVRGGGRGARASTGRPRADAAAAGAWSSGPPPPSPPGPSSPPAPTRNAKADLVVGPTAADTAGATDRPNGLLPLPEQWVGNPGSPRPRSPCDRHAHNGQRGVGPGGRPGRL